MELEELCKALASDGYLAILKRFPGDGEQWGCDLRNEKLGHWPQGFGITALDAAQNAAARAGRCPKCGLPCNWYPAVIVAGNVVAEEGDCDACRKQLEEVA